MRILNVCISSFYDHFQQFNSPTNLLVDETPFFYKFFHSSCYLMLVFVFIQLITNIFNTGNISKDVSLSLIVMFLCLVSLNKMNSSWLFFRLIPISTAPKYIAQRKYHSATLRREKQKSISSISDNQRILHPKQ